jgi:opacity protein-like surface antigen
MEERMKHLVAAALVAALCAAPASAQDKQAPAKQPNAEQQKRTDECTRQARERNLQGRERTQFMTSCMRGEKPK